MESAKDVGKNVEVNIYQESLDVLHSCATSEDDIDEMDITTRNIACNIAKKYIQKLVDKELPKKPIKPEEGSDQDWATEGLCQNCKSFRINDYEYDRHFKRCSDCGQLIDWDIDWSRDE